MVLYWRRIADSEAVKSSGSRSVRLTSSVRRIRILRSSGKTNAGARFIELNHDACEAAARLLVRAQSLGATRPEHYLTPENRSRISYGEHTGARGYDPLQHQAAWDTAWSRLTKEAGFPGLRFHDLRHSFISHLVERGVPLGVIQTFVGHLWARIFGTIRTSAAGRPARRWSDSTQSRYCHRLSPGSPCYPVRMTQFYVISNVNCYFGEAILLVSY